MGKNKKDTAISVTAYHNSDCAALIEKTQLDLTNTARQKAEELAEAELPKTDDDPHSFTSWITSQCNTLKSKVLSLLNVEGLKSKGASLLERFKTREEELKQSKTELSSRIRDAKKTVNRTNAESVLAIIKRWRVVHFFILALIGIEALALEQAMGVLSSSGLPARLLISAGVSLSTYFIAKKHVIESRKAETRVKRILVNAAMFGLAGTVFLLFGFLRMYYLETMDEKMAERSSEWIFAGVSMVFYLGCVVANSMYMPSSEDRERALHYTKNKEALTGLESKLEGVTKELDALPLEREKALYEIYSLIKMSEKYMEQVDHAYESIIGEFILHNTIKRHDGKSISIAQYKGQTIPPLKQYEFNLEQL